MPSRKFRVLVHGFDPGSSLGLDGPGVGFYTTRYLEAENEQEAAGLAVEMVTSEERLATVVKNEWRNQPVIKAEEVDELESLEGIPLPGAGYTFYGRNP